MPGLSSSLPGPGAVIAGKYLIERELGAGGMGTVFAARHQIMDKRVALKWLRQDAATGTAKGRFLREARAVARIKHPNVVDVYDVGEHEGSLFLVMECLDGEPLNALLSRGSPPLDALLRLLLPAMRGVAAAHAEGIVHRDIKPENIFLVRHEEHPGGLAKVLDFGISKLCDDPVQGTVTQTGTVIGTPAYMCKEQLNAMKDLDGRVDVYAFGVVLYQALSGALPYGGGSFMELVVRIATATATPLADLRPDLPLELCAIVHRAMAREREDRHGSMRDFVRALTEFAVAHGCASPAELHLGVTPAQGVGPLQPWQSMPPVSSVGTDPTLMGVATGPGAVSGSDVNARGLLSKEATTSAVGMTQSRKKSGTFVAAGVFLTLALSGGLLLRTGALSDVQPTHATPVAASALPHSQDTQVRAATGPVLPAPSEVLKPVKDTTLTNDSPEPAPSVAPEAGVDARSDRRASTRANRAAVRTPAAPQPEPREAQPAAAPVTTPAPAEATPPAKRKVQLDAENPWE